MIYLDNAATTPLDPEVRAAIEPFLGASFGNPSSRHPLGVAAARAVEEAREAIAQALGIAEPERVVFTSGGTEANNLGVLGGARARRRAGKHVLVGPTEHPSVRASVAALAAAGHDTEAMQLSRGGGLDLERAAASLREDTCLVAQMAVNNEFGSRYPVEELAALVRARAPRAHLHVDLVQAVGKVPFSLAELEADSVSISAHKLHGLKGAGALVLKEGARVEPLCHGGGQERDVRPGTENVVGIVALGAAVAGAARATKQTFEHLTGLREILAAGLTGLPGAELVAADGGGRNAFSPAIAALRLPGPPADVWMHHLERKGVYTSVGSACNARSKHVSPGLLALGLDDRSARQVLRLSFAKTTTGDDVREACALVLEVAEELRASTA